MGYNFRVVIFDIIAIILLWGYYNKQRDVFSMERAEYLEMLIGNIEKELLNDFNFKRISEIDKDTLRNKGFYCLRLKEDSAFPERYQSILEKRAYKYIYIGMTEKTLEERLSQELRHIKAGTFFRSIGCVLQKKPIAGHLKGKKNQNNYEFSSEVTREIVDWLECNVEVSAVKYDGDINIKNIEKYIIKKYSPLLNCVHNEMSLQELKKDKEECRKIARGQ